MTTPPFTVKGLGEIAIRCADVATMRAFYRDIIGLEVLSGAHDPAITFFRVAEGHRGHTTILALFARDAGRPELHPRSEDAPTTGAGSSLHHLALTVDYEAQDAAIDWYHQHDLNPRVQEFDWIGWRGVFVNDPEGNTVELVAKNPNWTGPAASTGSGGNT